MAKVENMVELLYVRVLSIIGVLLFLVSLYFLSAPQLWSITLLVTFIVVLFAFSPVVRLPAMGMTLTSVLNIFAIIVISPWSAIWIKSIEMILLAVVGSLVPARIAFNMGQLSFSILLAGFAWSVVDIYSGSVVLAAMFCVIAYFLANSVLVAWYYSLKNKSRFSKILLPMWRTTAISELALLTLGAITALLYESYGISSALVVVSLFFFIRHMLKQRIKDTDTIRVYAEELKKRYNASIASLARAIDARDPYTFGHSLRVAEMSRRTAAIVEPNYEPEDVYFGGLLHDVGKIALNDKILLKPGRLTGDELAMMMQHPVYGEEILKDSGVSPIILQAVRSHHEWVRGGGYPDNTYGAKIPLVARIVGVADAFDAMVSNRPYRRGCSMPEARARLLAGKNVQFDENVLNAFFRVLDTMNKEELLTIGYGEKPPNSKVLPVAELLDTSPTLAERLHHDSKYSDESEAAATSEPQSDSPEKENERSPANEDEVADSSLFPEPQE